MKKFYLLMVVALLVTAMSATAQRVLLRIPSNYEVNIDGRYYVNNETINSLGYGQHTVSLYQVRPGIWGIGKRRTLVSTSSFEMRNNDIAIEADQYGQLRINDYGYSGNKNRNRNNYPNDDYDYRKNNGRGNGNNGNGYGPYNNPGRGHKYGLYKKHHNKHDRDSRRDWDDDDDDNRNGNRN
ncbi:MAG: hypothetical protein ACM3H8_16065 [Sphingobacteriales bacterium]